MSRPLNLKRYKALSAAGVGRGRGADYRPALRVEDVGSRGKCTELLDPESGRHMQLLSNHELHAVLMLQWLPDCVEVNEQFALEPDRTRQAAAGLGLPHPSNHVMTTDILAHFRHGRKTRRQPIHVKPSDALGDVRTLELLEIEAAYWRQEDLELVVVTELEMDLTVAANLRWVRHSRTLPDGLRGHPLLGRAEFLLRLAFRERSEERLDGICNGVDDVLGIERGSCVTMVRHWIATRRWKVDIGVALAGHLPPPALPEVQRS